MAKIQRPLVTHTFKGKRFEDHGLDLDALPDLHAYKELLVTTAKELWRRHHPDRQRLPKNFEDSLCLKFYKLEAGGVAVPIVRELEVSDQVELWSTYEPDELDEAVLLVARAISAAESNQPLPEEFPKHVIPLFETYGTTLRQDESFELQPEGASFTASYNRRSRERLLQFGAVSYTDQVDLSGEVRAVDLAGRFEIRLGDGTRVPARFSPEQEDLVTEGLRDHATRRLRVKGTAEFNSDGHIKAIVAVSALSIQPVGVVDFDPSAPPVWEMLAELGASIPAEAWEKVPTDLATNLEHHLYGTPRSRQ